jgi:RNA polymerase sigma-70 factor (ECF subfamily)
LYEATRRAHSAAEWNERSVDLARLLAAPDSGPRGICHAATSATGRICSRWCCVSIGTAPRAEDILQEVYVNVWRAAKGFDAAQSQPLTWLTSIARNRAIDSLRRNQTRPQIQGSGAFDGAADGEDDSVYDTVADSAPGPLDLLSQASMRASWRRAWNT